MSLPRIWQFDWHIRDADLIQWAPPVHEITTEDMKRPHLNSKWGLSCPSAREECLTKHILTHINKDVLLANLSNVYFLQGRLDADNFTKPSEKKWCDILTKEQYVEMQQHKVLCLAMALITVHPTFIELDLLNSYVAHFGVAKRFILALERKFEKPVIPTDVTQAMVYWNKNVHWIEQQCTKAQMNTSDILGYDDLPRNNCICEKFLNPSKNKCKTCDALACDECVVPCHSTACSTSLCKDCCWNCEHCLVPFCDVCVDMHEDECGVKVSKNS